MWARKSVHPVNFARIKPGRLLNWNITLSSPHEASPDRNDLSQQNLLMTIYRRCLLTGVSSAGCAATRFYWKLPEHQG